MLLNLFSMERAFGSLLFIVSVPVSTSDVESAETSKLSVQIALEGVERNVAHARRYLSRKVREVTSKGIKCSNHIKVGQRACSITKFCQKEHMDLVIMTIHGKGGLRRATMGSVADEVIRTYKVPVLASRLLGRSKK